MRALTLLTLAIAAGCKKDKEEEAAPEAGALTLDAPAAGSWAAEGETRASGTAQHLTDLDVSGVHLDPARDWSTRVTLARGANVVEASGTDERGDTVTVRNGVLAGHFDDPAGAVEDAMSVRVNQPALDKLARMLEGMLTTDLIGGLIGGANPVYHDEYEVLGWSAASVSVDLVDVMFGAPDITITPSKGRLRVEIDIPDFQVDLYAYGEVIGFDLDSDIYMGADRLTGAIELSVDARQGGLEVELVESSLAFEGFWYDTSLIPGTIEDYIYVDEIAATIQETVIGQVNALVPPLLDETLSGLDPSFSTDILDKQVELTYGFGAVDVDDDGIFLSLDLDVAIQGNGRKEYPGFLGSPDEDPALSTHVEVSGAISDDLLNRVLFEAWSAGMLDISMSSADGSLSPAMLLPFKATSGAIALDAALPPVVIGQGKDIVAQIAELNVTVDLDDSELGSHLELAVNVEIPLDLSIESGVLALGLGDPALTLAVRDNDWGASNDTITRLVEESLPLDLLLALLGDFTVELPALYGMVVEEGTAARTEGTYFTEVTLGVDFE